MRKSFIPALIAAAAFSACNKVDKTPKDSCTLNVVDQIWKSIEKSVYEEGIGVHLTGKESIALFHYNGSSYEGVEGNVTYPIEATPTGTKGRYSFIRNGYDDKGWYSVMPYSSSLVRLQSNGSRVLMRLGAVQFPSRDSFDSSFDFLLGKPFDMTGNDGTIELFKRMFTPLKISVSGIPTEKIRSATIRFERDAQYNSSKVTDALAGAFYANFSEAFDEAKLANLATGSIANAVTAVYPDGISAQSGIQNVWYMVNPCSYPAGTKVEFTVFTDKTSYTKEFTLTQDINIEDGFINKMNIDLNNYETTSCSAVTTSFSSLSSASGDISIKASDGKSYSWKINAAIQDGCLKLGSSKYIVIPAMAGYRVTGIRIYTHANSVATNSKNEAFLSLVNTSGNTVASYSFNQFAAAAGVQSLNMNGGVLDIDIPKNYETMTGMKLLSSDSNGKLISAISLTVEGNGLVHGELRADGDSPNTYKLINDCGYQSVESPELCGVHTGVQHITQSYSEELGKYVFDFHIHINEDDDRGIATITDRQRNEIKTDTKSPKDMIAQDDETLRISWMFKLPAGMKTTSNFCHVHQLKGIGNDASVSTPLITFTCRNSGTGQVFQIIGREESSSSPNDYLCDNIDLKEFLGEWVSVTETVKFSVQGSYSVTIKRVRDGKELVKLTNVPRNFVRSTHPGYRPKWGIYRSFGENRSLASQLRDETIQFADFKIEKLFLQF